MNTTKKASIALLGLIFLAASSAHADPPVYRPAVIPECKVYTLKDGREVCGWLTEDEVKTAYRADAELVQCREQLDTHSERIESLNLQLGATTTALIAERRSTEVLKERNTELTADLIEMNRKYENERVKPRWGSPIAWTTAAILGAGLLGFIGNDLL